MVEAFKGMDTVVFIPSIIHPSFKRIPEVENLVYAAKQSGVAHIIFIGYYADQHNNPFHMSPYFGYASRLLATSGIDYTYVRMAMYMDPLKPYLPELMNMHKLIYPLVMVVLIILLEMILLEVSLLLLKSRYLGQTLFIIRLQL